MAEMKPGVFQGIPFDEYASWPAANHSVLAHFRKTPAHARYAMEHPPESKAMALGYLVHLATLEPEVYKRDVVVAPKLDKRTKAGKADWARFEKEAESKIIAGAEDAECASEILKNIDAHPVARELLRAEGSEELSLVWTDEATGVLCKGRIDRLTTLNDQPIVVDVKTVGEPASTHAFQGTVMRFDYHGQAAHYLLGLHALMPDAPIPKFAWVACETKGPYAVRVFEADDEALAIGAENMAKALGQFKECRESGFWPSWPDGMDIAGLPAWAMKRYAIE